MTEQAEQFQKQEMTRLGMAFMGFLMGAGAILGIWFLSGLIPLVSMMLGS
jgi:hypothetical protein